MMGTELEYIQGFSPMFSHILDDKGVRLKSPLGATTYYIYLITKFPTNFRSIATGAKRIMGDSINPSKLQSGRNVLLDHGFIAEVLPVFGVNSRSDRIFDREMFLPISPRLAWQDYSENLKGILSPDGMLQRDEMVNELETIYRNNFGIYGTRIETGSITVFHSSRWALYLLAYNIKNNSNLLMLLGGLGSFEEPFLKYYDDLLRRGLKTRLIFDPAVEGVETRFNTILNLKEKYKDNLEVRATPLSYGTSRRLICDNMVIDSRKVIDLKKDLSYISTIYFQEHIIKRMRDNFELAWKHSLDTWRETI